MNIDKVAKALWSADRCSNHKCPRRSWGWEQLTPRQQGTYRLMAQAAIDAMELRTEFTWSWPNGSAQGVPGYGFSVETKAEAESEGSNVVSRYVTDWETAE